MGILDPGTGEDIQICILLTNNLMWMFMQVVSGTDVLFTVVWPQAEIINKRDDHCI